MRELQPLRGTKDLLPEDYKVHEYIINRARQVGTLYGYQSMSTPIMEYARVFSRSMGETSDVISKEIYSFHDKSDDVIALRPEFTAGIMRACISNNLQYKLPLKFFSYGPIFRYDRPQLGRQRQFHQVNFEHIGADTPFSDAEVIKLAMDILTSLEITQDVVLEINSLGCTQSRELYQQKLVEYLNDYRDQLSADSVTRLEKNPMRILDSKNINDQTIVAGAPVLSDHYSSDAKKYFEELQRYLDLLNVKYVINSRLVRGLDYYCHTTFEITTTKLGSQSTIIAGGRYNGLSHLMGGVDMPTIGFAGGVERIALMREYNVPLQKLTYIMPINESNLDYAVVLSKQLRQKQIPVIIDSTGKIAKRVQRAVAQNSRYIIFIGDEEQVNNNLKLKDLDQKQEYSLSFDGVVEILLGNG